MSDAEQSLDQLALRRYQRDGYMVVPGLCPAALVDDIVRAARAHLRPLVGPAEFDADVGYPGAPASRAAPGGDTPRRLLHAYARHEAFRRWSTGAPVKAALAQLFGTSAVQLSQAHHNCVMTKHPGYSSKTMWHQDVRYWSFDRPELVSVWLALGHEDASNGALQVIPGSHNIYFDRGRLDRDLFLRQDLAANRQLIDSAVTVELEAGDVLFFSCNLFHAAGKNATDEVKLSFVTTYHTADNRPIPDTRSALYPSVAL